MIVKDGLRFVGTGHYVPEKVVTNDDLSKLVDTNDEWISSRTGMKRRHFIEEDEKNQDMAIEAVRLAIENAGIDKSEIGACVVATFHPDDLVPSMACMVQTKLGLPEDIPSFDINAACSGFMYALAVTRGLLMQSDRRYAVLVGSEVISRVMDMTDRGTCILFGDGAGAAVVELADNKFISVLGSRGDDEILHCPNTSRGDRFVTMRGNDVFKFAVTMVPKTVNELLEKAGITADEIDYFVCHQANKRIIESVAKKCGQPMEKFYINMHEYGNTSSASIPIALDEMNRSGMLKPGMKIICVGFGAGLTWGGSYIEW